MFGTARDREFSSLEPPRRPVVRVEVPERSGVEDAITVENTVEGAILVPSLPSDRLPNGRLDRTQPSGPRETPPRPPRPQPSIAMQTRDVSWDMIGVTDLEMEARSQ